MTTEIKVAMYSEKRHGSGAPRASWLAIAETCAGPRSIAKWLKVTSRLPWRRKIASFVKEIGLAK